VKAHAIIAAAVLIVPMIATAQGGMGRMGGGRRGGRGESGNESAKEGQLKSDDIQKMNPAKVLLDKRKDLNLDDAQKTQLESVANRYEWNTRVFVGVVDSLQGVPGGPKGGALTEALRTVRQEFDTASARSMAVLTEAQRPLAEKLIEGPTVEIETQLANAGLHRPMSGTRGVKPPGAASP
jgi:hypothetical protein